MDVGCFIRLYYKWRATNYQWMLREAESFFFIFEHLDRLSNPKWLSINTHTNIYTYSHAYIYIKETLNKFYVYVYMVWNNNNFGRDHDFKREYRDHRELE